MLEKWQIRFYALRDFFREFVVTNDEAPKVQLQRTRAWIAVISFRKWNFRANDASRAFLKSVPLGRETYADPPYASGNKETETRKLSKPLYGLSATCKEWYISIGDSLLNECGGETGIVG